MALDLTAQTGPLAEATARMSRLLPTRTTHPGQAAVSLRADRDGLLLTAGDADLSVRLRVPATSHEDGEAVVPRRGLAETVAALDVPEVRLAVEGARLAVRTPAARFALPHLAGNHPVLADLPPAVGEVPGVAVRTAAVPVAGAASREHALPIFTGVRLRSRPEGLALLATDRYRLAVACVPWLSAVRDAVDVLVPAPLLAEAARQAGRAQAVTVHAGGDLFGLSWPGCAIVTATLGAAFPDTQLDRLLQMEPECVIEVDAGALGGAVERASRYAGAHGRVCVQAGDGALAVRASDAVAGESEETVKATVQGDRVTRFYQARLLLDALRPFGADAVAMRVQAGMRATEFTEAARGEVEIGLRYLVVPMRPPEAERG